MSGRNTFSELTGQFSAEQRTLVNERKAELRAAMALRELREARELTQSELAGRLGVNQPAVAKLERRADTTVSSLRSYVEALGGKLIIVAELPDEDVVLTGLGDREADGVSA